MPNYTEDRRWSDQFIPQIKRIVGPHLLEVTSFEVDTQEAADLIIMHARTVTLACRVRRPGYEKYVGQFTIRAKRDTGVTTELQKITNGWGDLMFYGHVNEQDDIWAWLLVDLHAFRAHLIRTGKPNKSGMVSNRDGTYFAWFNAFDFPPEPPLLVATNLENHPSIA